MSKTPRTAFYPSPSTHSDDCVDVYGAHIEARSPQLIRDNMSSGQVANASANGYANDGTTSTVTVNIPPKSGPSTGKAGYAEVIVECYQNRFFSSIWGTGNP